MLHMLIFTRKNEAVKTFQNLILFIAAMLICGCSPTKNTPPDPDKYPRIIIPFTERDTIIGYSISYDDSGKIVIQFDTAYIWKHKE